MIAQSMNPPGMIQLSQYHQSTEQISNEQAIIEAARTDNRKFEPLYKMYYPRIVAFVYQRVDDKETAFEITSDVFYAALKNLHQYKSEGLPFSAWLFRIAINKINELFRKQKVRRTITIEAEGVPQLVQEIQREELVSDKQLFDALQSLDPDDLNLVEMRFFENRPFKEICEITGLGESACKMKLYRILEKLKSTLKNL
jgi:RNA polymerase sigma-70 factor (ECF subfamily)